MKSDDCLNDWSATGTTAILEMSSHFINCWDNRDGMKDNRHGDKRTSLSTDHQISYDG
jgi:hypothetical protein